ncbi:MAG: sterol desaturase family protein [Reyranella sp.]|jgi:sterol desaturase/sphingolipid hydroxylase (fatty acid hydroxylase superfamily)|nr:sterol desaturase family protein [Reyranella sp.]
MQHFIRWLAYPLVMAATCLAILGLPNAASASVLVLPAITLAGVLTVGALERLAPYEPAWLHSDGDVLADIQYNVLGVILLQASIFIVYPASSSMLSLDLWPKHWPLWANVLTVAVIVDFGLYWMHRWSHDWKLLWRFHQPHHSPRRLYWLNGERRHVISALILAAPGLTTVALLGAPQAALAAWFAILPVHLAFQHANIDYSLGPFRVLFGVAEMHRWHHKRDYEDAQVNFGEVLLVWDWLFGTQHGGSRIGAGELGLRDTSYPKGFWSQHLAPFRARQRQL